MSEANLTDEQSEFLAQCEEEFKDRYTEKDKDFMKLKSQDYRKPPIIDPWYNKPRRPNYDWSRQNQGGRRNHNSDRRNDRNSRYDRNTGKHHPYQRNQRPY